MLPTSIAKVVERLERATTIKRHEMPATLVAFTIVFLLMASYFVLRPIRDAMASDWSDTEVSFLWNIQFFVSVAIICAYGLLVSRVSHRYLVPTIYAIFAVSFLAFYFCTPRLSTSMLAEKTFYIWVSAFSLLHISVFWSLVSETFSKQQAKRVFAIIASGASAGALAGPLISALFANRLGLDALMLIAASGLIAVVPLVILLNYLKEIQLRPSSSTVLSEKSAIGGLWWGGFRDFLSSRYLLYIGAFVLLYVFIGSFIYFEQKNLLAEFSRTERAKILALIDLLANSLTFLMAFFVTSRIVTRLGMPVALAVMPLCLFFGMFVLAFAPLIVVVIALQVSRRAGNYAITRPAREMLFSQVSQEQRFKSKPVIDVVVYRGGDAASGALFAFLSEGLGLGLALIAIVGAGISAAWTFLAIKLGHQYEGAKELSFRASQRSQSILIRNSRRA